MANEGRLSISASLNKSGTSESKSLTDQFDVASANYIVNRQTIGTSDETLALGDVATNGYFVYKNCDSTNYIEIGHTSGTYTIKAKAGEIGAFRAGAALTAIHAKANTASCDLEYFLLSD